ncbi:hypothetical protein [Nocardia donostiensis]|uniref:Uncharacterized protein n=1 Tax=Nocardia donostiensis TaxID=1538463 RepID=A0A1W0B105_9NOCA|nr:hypothetical protein B0T46_25625 [Nocardia donostiensis]OQS16202.1 hypothetical protein B0T36_05325 [Nocardia donostiensis]OQS16487.1 hypothetical protein B0T44_25245 [Nocardia donostiensis]
MWDLLLQPQTFSPVQHPVGARESVDDDEQVLLDGAVHFGHALEAVVFGLGDQRLGLFELTAMLRQEL